MTRLREVPNFWELKRRDVLLLRDKLVLLALHLLAFRVQGRFGEFQFEVVKQKIQQQSPGDNNQSYRNSRPTKLPKVVLTTQLGCCLLVSKLATFVHIRKLPIVFIVVERVKRQERTSERFPFYLL